MFEYLHWRFEYINVRVYVCVLKGERERSKKRVGVRDKSSSISTYILVLRLGLKQRISNFVVMFHLKDSCLVLELVRHSTMLSFM